VRLLPEVPERLYKDGLRPWGVTEALNQAAEHGGGVPLVEVLQCSLRAAITSSERLDRGGVSVRSKRSVTV